MKLNSDSEKLIDQQMPVIMIAKLDFQRQNLVHNKLFMQK